jgi:hypothetical protein
VLSVFLEGTAPGGINEVFSLEFIHGDLPFTHTAVRGLGARLAKVQTPRHLQLRLEREYGKLESFMRGLSAIGTDLTLCGTNAVEFLLNALEGEGDRDEGETIFGCLSDLTIASWEDLSEYGLYSQSAEPPTAQDPFNYQIGRLIRGLKRRRALGVTALRSLTFVDCPGLAAKTVRTLISTCGGNLQVAST